MRAKPTSYRLPTQATLLALALLYSSPLPAQDSNLQNSIDSTAAALAQLDLKARDCLSALDRETDSQPPCDEFIAAIDGELMADYLVQCRELKEWRRNYVDNAVAAGADNDDTEQEEMLRRLVAIEYNCGENTVLERTEFVAIAFTRLRNGSASTTGGTDAASISRQLSERRFNALEANERQRLLDAVQGQQNRSQQESERQFNDLENELLRQQIRNSNRPLN